jgi:hypothetical protein
MEMVETCKLLQNSLSSHLEPEFWFSCIFLIAKCFKNVELKKYTNFEHRDENPFQARKDVSNPDGLVEKALSVLEGLR